MQHQNENNIKPVELTQDAPLATLLSLWPHAATRSSVSRALAVQRPIIQRPPAFLRIASARRRARSRSADLLLSDVPRCEGLSESPAVAARPSRRAAAFARAALLAFAAALMRHVPAAVLSRAAPAVLGRADESSPGLLLQPLRGGGPAAEGRDDSADLSLQVASSSMKLPRRSLERLRAPDELNAARITLARPARRDVGLPGAALFTIAIIDETPRCSWDGPQ